MLYLFQGGYDDKQIQTGYLLCWFPGTYNCSTAPPQLNWCRQVSLPISYSGFICLRYKNKYSKPTEWDVNMFVRSNSKTLHINYSLFCQEHYLLTESKVHLTGLPVLTFASGEVYTPSMTELRITATLSKAQIWAASVLKRAALMRLSQHKKKKTQNNGLRSHYPDRSAECTVD